jgi:hypothetical protein
MVVKVESQYSEQLTEVILVQTVLMVYRGKLDLLLALILVPAVLEEQPLAVKEARAVVVE